MESVTYPLRLNRHLYLEKICSRREADRMIQRGEVLVNNRVAVLGQKINKDDVVSLVGHARRQSGAKKYYLAFHKPVGVVSHNPRSGEQSPEDFTRDIPTDLFPLGRLDKASRGLMILSNDGTIVNKLLHPQFNHEKEYRVTVDKRIDKDFITQMNRGVLIEGYQTKPAEAHKIDARSFSLVLTEGKKHQIRRMCAALGYQVQDLKRERIQNIRLGKLKPGCHRNIDGKELLDFMKSINH